MATSVSFGFHDDDSESLVHQPDLLGTVSPVDDDPAVPYRAVATEIDAVPCSIFTTQIDGATVYIVTDNTLSVATFSVTAFSVGVSTVLSFVYVILTVVLIVVFLALIFKELLFQNIFTNDETVVV